MKSLIHLLLAGGLLLLVGCSSDSIDNPENPPVPLAEYTFASFDLSSGNPGAFPLPNDVLRDPVTGRVNFPEFGDPAVDALIAQLNTIRGFSTLAPIRIPFDGLVDPNTVNAGSVILVDLADLQAASQGAAVDPVRPLDIRLGLDETETNHVITAFPVTPLKPNRPHLVILTGAIIGDPSGLPIESDATMTLLKGNAPLSGDFAALEPLRQLYDSTLWPAAEGVTGVSRTFIPQVFAFTTQPLYDTLGAIHERYQTENPMPDIATAFVGQDAIDSLYSLIGFSFVPNDFIGAIYTGSYDSPNYITDPLTGSFQGEGDQVVEQGRVPINFIATTPPGPGPFPVVIYQHGLGSFKETGLILANDLAFAGFGLIAIDIALHGERSIDGDGDGVIDPSGTNFLNVASPITGRDNNRQTVADLMMLTRMITAGNTDFNGNGSPEYLPLGVTYAGISMGGIVGGVFTPSEANIGASVLNVAGGRLLYLLQESPVIGPSIDAGLAQFGLQPGTLLYDLFYMFAQTILDDADPANYITQAASGGLTGGPATAILIQEAIDDPVVPNSATETLARAANLTQLNAIEEIAGLTQAEIPPTGFVGSGLTQFIGGHGTLLDPSDGPTLEVGFQALTFVGSSLVGDPVIIDPTGLFPTKQNRIFSQMKSIDFSAVDLEIDPQQLLLLPKTP